MLVDYDEVYKVEVDSMRFGNNSCRYQSITQQYLKRFSINDDSNYMFRHNAAIIRFSSEIMVVILYRIGMVISPYQSYKALPPYFRLQI